MKSFNEVYASLRKKNIGQYALLFGSCFFSITLITAYLTMMRSPMVLNVLPEGGDSRKQVMMIFAMAVIGCAVFVLYACNLFLRQKSQEIGIFMALGASRRQIASEMRKEFAWIGFLACGLGMLLGGLLALGIWQVFRLILVDTAEMAFVFSVESFLLAGILSVVLILALFYKLTRFISRTNIIDIVSESRKSEPIKDIPHWYGVVGILLVVVFAFVAYITPGLIINNLHWYPPEGLTAVLYIPVVIGLYMMLLHTVVNGWSRGKGRYKKLISTSMMKFEGRQTVNNMLVITILVAGAYFASFYAPMLATGSSVSFDQRQADYEFHYRMDQDLPTEQEIRHMADEEGVVITDYASQSVAILGVDGEEYSEAKQSLGTTYTHEYVELLRSEVFLSASAYYALTGEEVSVAPSTIGTVFMDDGTNGYTASNTTTVVTNPLTGETLSVDPLDLELRNTLLLGCKVLNDVDYEEITVGLTDEWREERVFFNVENEEESYAFAKRLFYEIVDRSNADVEVYDAWNPIVKRITNERGESYWLDNDNVAVRLGDNIDYTQKDSSNFRMYWKYMPQFRVLDKEDFVKTTAVFLLLFIFIAIICFSAVMVIVYTRSLTIALNNKQVFDDLHHLGANNAYLRRVVKEQIKKVFFTPTVIGTVIIYAFYMMIMFFNDGYFSWGEIVGLISSLGVIVVVSTLIYLVYRYTYRKVCTSLHIAKEKKPGSNSRKPSGTAKIQAR